MVREVNRPVRVLASLVLSLGVTVSCPVVAQTQPAGHFEELIVRSGDTLTSVFRRAEIATANERIEYRIVNLAGGAHHLNDIQAGDRIIIRRAPFQRHRLDYLLYQIDLARCLEIVRVKDTFSAAIYPCDDWYFSHLAELGFIERPPEPLTAERHLRMDVTGGESFYDFLSDMDAAADVADFVDADRRLERIQVGDTFFIRQDRNRRIQSVRFCRGRPTANEPTCVVLERQGRSVKRSEPETRSRVRATAVRISSSWIDDARQAGVDSSLIAKVRLVLTASLDFAFERLRPDDRISIAYEEEVVDVPAEFLEQSGRASSAAVEGRKALLAVRFIPYRPGNGRQEVMLTQYRLEEGDVRFFSSDGRDRSKRFLLQLLNCEYLGEYVKRDSDPARVSGKGIFFPANVGLPVCASGGGEIVELRPRPNDRSVDKNFGRYVAVKHKGGYITRYANLAEVHPGLRLGTRIDQLQVIGFVGSSAMDAPGLWYQMERLVSQVDRVLLSPKAIRDIGLVPGDDIPQQRIPEFHAQRERYLVAMERASHAAP